jgi:hypothetical protein
MLNKEVQAGALGVNIHEACDSLYFFVEQRQAPIA